MHDTFGEKRVQFSELMSLKFISFGVVGSDSL